MGWTCTGPDRWELALGGGRALVLVVAAGLETWWLREGDELREVTAARAARIAGGRYAAPNVNARPVERRAHAAARTSGSPSGRRFESPSRPTPSEQERSAFSSAANQAAMAMRGRTGRAPVRQRLGSVTEDTRAGEHPTPPRVNPPGTE